MSGLFAAGTPFHIFGPLKRTCVVKVDFAYPFFEYKTLCASRQFRHQMEQVIEEPTAIYYFVSFVAYWTFHQFLNVLIGLSVLYLAYYSVYHLLPFFSRSRGKISPVFNTTFQAVMEKAETAPEETVDVIIVGAGVAGCAVAKALSATGKRVLVLERDLSEPNRIVGELMQPGGLDALASLGMLGCVEGIDSQTTVGYAIHRPGNDTLLLGFPNKEDGEGYVARTFHHGRFIQNLRECADAEPNVELRTATVTSVIEEAGCVVGVNYKADGVAKTVHAPLTFLCDGCFSRFRKDLSQSCPTTDSYFVGIIIENVLPNPEHGNVFLLNPTPLLAYPIGSNEVRVLMDIPAPLPRGEELKTYIYERILPQLSPEMATAVRTAIEKDGLRSMPNMKLHPAPIRKAGCVLLGDAWNCRHPLTGGGMTVALSDVVTLTRGMTMLEDMGDYDAVEYVIRDLFFPARKVFASSVNILAYALYKVFSTNSERQDAEVRQELRSACIDYLKMGGRASSGPMLLLSGLHSDKSPYFLIRYFFEVAFFGAGNLLYPPTLSRLYVAFKVMWLAVEIIAPLMYNELLASLVYTN